MELLRLDLPGWQVCEDRLGLCLPSSEQSSCCIWAAPLPPLVCAHHGCLVWGLCFIVHTSPSWTSLLGGVGSMAASNSICWERNSLQGLQHLDIKWESWDLKTSRSAVPNLTFSRVARSLEGSDVQQELPLAAWAPTQGGEKAGASGTELLALSGNLSWVSCVNFLFWNNFKLSRVASTVHNCKHLNTFDLSSPFSFLDIFFLSWIKMQMQFPVIP